MATTHRPRKTLLPGTITSNTNTTSSTVNLLDKYITLGFLKISLKGAFLDKSFFFLFTHRYEYI